MSGWDRDGDGRHADRARRHHGALDAGRRHLPGQRPLCSGKKYETLHLLINQLSYLVSLIMIATIDFHGLTGGAKHGQGLQGQPRRQGYASSKYWICAGEHICGKTMGEILKGS